MAAKAAGEQGSSGGPGFSRVLPSTSSASRATMASRSAPVARRIVGVCMLQLLPQRQRGERRQRAEAERELAEQPLARAAEQPRSGEGAEDVDRQQDRKSTRLNSSH